MDFWDVNLKDEIIYRNNVSLSNQKGNEWIKIDGLLKNIFVVINGV